MIDLEFLRENPDIVEKAAKNKKVELDLLHVLEVDKQYRQLVTEVQNLRFERNKAATERNIERGRQIKEKLEEIEVDLKKAEDDLKKELLKIPNLPLDHLPVGDESANKVIKEEGEPKKFDFRPRDHLEIGEALDIIDVERAAKVSGSRFAYLKGEGVLLELALVQYALATLTKKGFTPVFPPVLIRQDITDGLGYWQAGGNENYYLVHDVEEAEGGGKVNPLYLVGTGEHSIVPMHMDETMQGLPKKYVAFSPCFRREAGSYGRDTRGILRVHQFDKVEMVAFVRPEEDAIYRKEILEAAESLVRGLGLPYQLVQLATGDISFPAAETIDIETWMPSQKKYRETHSISTTTDFQARRLGIRYQEGDSKKFVHILNGTALAMPRTIIAILENYQQEDGSVVIPEVLRKYMHGIEMISPRS